MRMYCTEKDIVLIEILGEYLLVALLTEERRHSRVRQINAAGADIWKLLEMGKPLSDITEGLSQKYEDIEKGVLERDVTIFVEELCSAGYLKEMDMEEI